MAFKLVVKIDLNRENKFNLKVRKMAVLFGK
jgi:hypothetical protein